MEKSNKRGKIPQSDWPLIMERYDAGETLASIARTYDCSPPAISYVVSRSKARQPGAEPQPKAAGGSEAQLIKGAAPNGTAAPAEQTPIATPAVANGHDRSESAAVPGDGQHDNRTERAADSLPAAGMMQASDARNGISHPAVANGEHRRTLHLSLGDPAPRNGGSRPAEIRPELESPLVGQGIPLSALPSPSLPSSSQDDVPVNGASRIPPNGYPEHIRRNDVESAAHKKSGTFIDSELRARVDGDIAAFLAAFDAALGQDSQENRAALREATDRLLRAGARTRIELERLEARLPLPPRNDGRAGEMGWRAR
jgi:hypothetical protein